jgi:hypothetical protein
MTAELVILEIGAKVIRGAVRRGRRHRHLALRSHHNVAVTPAFRGGLNGLGP